LWNAHTAEFLAAESATDAGGVNLAPDGDGFVLTTGTGRMLRLAGDDRRRIASFDARHWDNHLVSARG